MNECMICQAEIPDFEGIECEECGELFCSGSCERKHGCEVPGTEGRQKAEKGEADVQRKVPRGSPEFQAKMAKANDRYGPFGRKSRKLVEVLAVQAVQEGWSDNEFLTDVAYTVSQKPPGPNA